MTSMTPEYCVPQEAERIFLQEILNNPLIKKSLPNNLHELSKFVKFEGHDKPSVPFPWRWAESISALKALEATVLLQLLQRKYDVVPTEVNINTDHATLFVFGTALAKVVDEGKSGATTAHPLDPDTLTRMAPPARESQYRLLGTNIYKTRDGRYYHTHGSLNATPTLTALGLPEQTDSTETLEASVQRIQEKVLQFDAEPLDRLMNEEYRQAGTVARSTDEYLRSAHGLANANVGLYELYVDKTSSQPRAWWPENSSMPSSPQRPLAGLKVVDLTRVIAGPTIARSLAELGASVMRVTAPHLPDLLSVHRDLNWGKWNCHLDLKDKEQSEKLRRLILEADVVVDGYRPNALDRLGFSREAIFEMVKGRDRGIIHLRENCYGWHGPWAHRSGWQGISDACCGVSLEFGRAMGLDEAVTPPFPNSDHCTGAIGSAAILHALIERAERGGSYGIDTALNYYSQWLVRSCGMYPPQVWTDLWSRHGSPIFRHYDNTRKTVPAMVELLHQYDEAIMFNPIFFEDFYSGAIDATIRRVKPVANFKDGLVELKYNVGTRGNGVDQAYWPNNLQDEIVS